MNSSPEQTSLTPSPFHSLSIRAASSCPSGIIIDILPAAYIGKYPSKTINIQCCSGLYRNEHTLFRRLAAIEKLTTPVRYLVKTIGKQSEHRAKTW